MAAMVYRILKDNPRYRWLSIATSNSQRVSIWSSLRQLFPRAYACTCGHINNNLNIIHVIYACNCFNKAKITHLYEYYEWTHTDIYIYMCVCVHMHICIYTLYITLWDILYIYCICNQPSTITQSPCLPVAHLQPWGSLKCLMRQSRSLLKLCLGPLPPTWGFITGKLVYH